MQNELHELLGSNKFPFARQTVDQLFNSWSTDTHKYSKMYYGVRPQALGVNTIVTLSANLLPIGLSQIHQTPGLEEFVESNSSYFSTLLNELPFGTCIYGKFNSPAADRDDSYAANRVTSTVFYVEGVYYPSDPVTGAPEKLFTQHSDVSYVLGLPSNGEAITNGKLLYEQGIAPMGHFPGVCTVDFSKDNAESVVRANLKNINTALDEYIYNFFRVKGRPLGFVMFPMFSSAPTMSVLEQWTAAHRYE